VRAMLGCAPRQVNPQWIAIQADHIGLADRKFPARPLERRKHFSHPTNV